MRGILLYIAIAYGGAWLVALPLWLSGEGLATPGATLLIMAMMFVPAIAAFIAARLFPARPVTDAAGASASRPGVAVSLGLRPWRPVRRWVKYALLGWFAPIVIVVAALALAWALGVYKVDLVNFSGLAEQLEALTAGTGTTIDMPIQALVISQLAPLLIAPLINAIPALGEELGWRGFLQPRLHMFGRWGAMVVTGVIWALWHAPVILLGYNYPGYPVLAALGFMLVFCVLMSILLGWLREASDSIYPVAIAHGSVNGAVGIGAVFVAAGHPIDPAVAGLLGWTGWIVLAVCVVAVLLVARRRRPVAYAPGVTLASSGASPDLVTKQ